jgi:uncharacterized Ntn-hydrolase superfamily protein
VTFSVAAIDGDGALGIAVTSSSPAVGARCAHVRSGVAAVASQNVTDPRLGPLLLDRIAAGVSPEQALGELSQHPDISYRQLTILDQQGRAAAYSGAGTLGLHHQVAGDGVVAAGNLLSSAAVIDAVVLGFAEARGELETRLVQALAAGLRAGGEAGPLRSACVAVVRDQDWRVTDLRVDWHDEPIAELARLLTVWLPQRDDYVTRALDPARAPSYGVPGER